MKIAIFLLSISMITAWISSCIQYWNIESLLDNQKHQQELINKMTWDIIIIWDEIKWIKEDIIKENRNDLMERVYNENISFISKELNIKKECLKNQFDWWTFFQLVDSPECVKFKSKFTKKDAVEFSIYEEVNTIKKVNILDYNYNEVK